MSSAPFTHALRVSQLNPRRPDPVDLSPDDEARARIAAALDLTAPPEVRLTGTITAALFLQRFVEKTACWAHFDIFGWNPSDRPHCPIGGEAQGIRALEQLLSKRYAA